MPNMTSISIYATTFNCGRSPPSPTAFSTSLFSALTSASLPPDLLVLSLQELAPLGYSFLGGSLLAPYFANFEHAIHRAVEERWGQETGYALLSARNVGMTGLMVWAREGELRERIRWVRNAGVGCGVAEMGNKGAVGLRVGLEGEGEGDDEAEVVLTVVAAHLAPMEEAWERRNVDWKSICENLVFELDDSSPGSDIGTAQSDDSGEESAPLLSAEGESRTEEAEDQHTLFHPPSHILFLGDLNYRTSDTVPSSSQHETYPQPTASQDDRRHWANLLPKDQLNRERTADRTLHHLDEAKITFPPTYKYSAAAQKHAAEMEKRKQGRDGTGMEDEVWLWAKHRVPSWCDRILFYPALPASAIHAYDALPIQPSSDHRPVALSYSIPLERVQEKAQSPFQVRRDWRERRAAARRYELLVGAATYLAWTWEGEALLLGTVVGLLGGWAVLRGLLVGLS